MSDEVLVFMCTANQCRSPMAQAIAEKEAAHRDLHLDIRSCGVFGGGAPMTDAAVAALRRAGVSADLHESRALDQGLAAEADLIVTMERDHLATIAEWDLDALNRSFPLRELVRIAVPAEPGETLREWSERMNEQRSPGEVLRVDVTDDVADPMGRAARHYRRCAAELADLVAQLFDLLEGAGAPSPT